MPKLNTEHIIVSNRPGTVAVLFCRNCQEELPITKPLKVTTLAAIIKTFGKCHAQCLPAQTQHGFLEVLDGK